ncbi:MAG: 2,3-bisphosphoglycerate-independent phosphoglycerate mutase [Bacillota bacterium]
MPVRPLVLVVMDGWGMNPSVEGNAIAYAKTPVLDRLYRTYPWTTLATSGEAVGLIPGQMGDSNVGHLNIGAGRIVYQWLGLIGKAIRSGEFAKNPVIREGMQRVKASGKALHLMGLVSDGGVHSHIDHLVALLRMAKDHGIQRVYVHAFLDGRDVPPQSAIGYLERLEHEMASIGVGQIATVMGRYYAMDRDKRWERVQLAWEAMIHGQGEQAGSATQAVEQSYAKGENDEFVKPTVIVRDGSQPVVIEDDDSVFFFNFRADRAREISHALLDEEFLGFDRGHRPRIWMAGMTEYEKNLPMPQAFAPVDMTNTFGEVVARHGLKQLRIAETEKYAHVTFFFNGGVEEVFPGEERKLVPSPKVATYDQQPEMSAYLVTDALLEELRADHHDVVILNFANGDMVGHTGDFAAAVKAVEVVDECLGKITELVLKKGGAVLVTSDHGNCDQMVDPKTGEPHTAHTATEVPFILAADGYYRLRNEGILADIAPTMLQLLGIPQPAEMTGKTLLQSPQPAAHSPQ